MNTSHQGHESSSQSEHHAEPRQVRTVATALAICALGWSIPGSSHLALGRWVRGLLFATAILTMFSLGIAMQGRLYDISPERPLDIFAFIADVGAGLPYVVAQRMGYGSGVLSSPSYDYGSTYLWVAGLLNYLVVLDAFDIARGRKP